MLRFAGAVLCAVMSLGPLHAQTVPEDAMEVQRCVWRCLDASSGVESAEYHACVAEQCGEAEAPPAASKKPPAWSVVEEYEGRGRAAWATDGVMGTELFVVCAPDGSERFIDLLGAEGPDAVLELNIDGEKVFPLMFRNVDGRARAVLEPPFAEIAALKAGNSLALLNEAGYSVFSSSLRGSTKALTGACVEMAAAVAPDAPAEEVAAPAEPVEAVEPEQAVAGAGEAAPASSALRGAYFDLTHDLWEQQCVTLCVAATPGATSPEFAACVAEMCTPDRLDSLVGGPRDPATTTARPGEGPFSPMPWEARDIPSCMAACELLTPANSAEGHTCVIENCDREYLFLDQPSQERTLFFYGGEPFVPPAPAWEVWSSEDGLSRIAGVRDPNTGNRFSIWCPVDGGERSFVLEGPLTPALTLDVVFQETSFQLRFRPEGAVLRAALAGDALEIDVLARSPVLWVLMVAGYPLTAVTMNGAAEAIAEACP